MGGVTVEGSTARNASPPRIPVCGSPGGACCVPRGSSVHLGSSCVTTPSRPLGTNPIQPIPLVPKSDLPPPLFSAAPGLRVSPLRVHSPCREVT